MMAPGSGSVLQLGWPAEAVQLFDLDVPLLACPTCGMADHYELPPPHDGWRCTGCEYLLFPPGFQVGTPAGMGWGP